MGYLVRLVTLNLSHNMIKELPSDITSMRCKFYTNDEYKKSSLYFSIIILLFYQYLYYILMNSVKNT